MLLVFLRGKCWVPCENRSLYLTGLWSCFVPVESNSPAAAVYSFGRLPEKALHLQAMKQLHIRGAPCDSIPQTPFKPFPSWSFCFFQVNNWSRSWQRSLCYQVVPSALVKRESGERAVYIKISLRCWTWINFFFSVILVNNKEQPSVSLVRYWLATQGLMSSLANTQVVSLRSVLIKSVSWKYTW